MHVTYQNDCVILNIGGGILKIDLSLKASSKILVAG